MLRRDCPLSVLEWSILGSEFHDGPRALSKQEEPASDFVSSSQWDNPESVVRLGTVCQRNTLSTLSTQSYSK